MSRVSPTRPVYGERWIGHWETDPTSPGANPDGRVRAHCPVTDLPCPVGKAVWSRGRLLHPKGVDEPGRGETVFATEFGSEPDEAPPQDSDFDF